MADNADRADVEIERATQQAIKQSRAGAMRPLGACYWCGDAAPPAGLFCGPDCRDDWQRERDARARNGG
jgi:hypothetical protein